MFAIVSWSGPLERRSTPAVKINLRPTAVRRSPPGAVQSASAAERMGAVIIIQQCPRIFPLNLGFRQHSVRVPFSIQFSVCFQPRRSHRESPSRNRPGEKAADSESADFGLAATTPPPITDLGKQISDTAPIDFRAAASRATAWACLLRWALDPPRVNCAASLPACGVPGIARRSAQRFRSIAGRLSENRLIAGLAAVVDIFPILASFASSFSSRLSAGQVPSFMRLCFFAVFVLEQPQTRDPVFARTRRPKGRRRNRSGPWSKNFSSRHAQPVAPALVTTFRLLVSAIFHCSKKSFWGRLGADQLCQLRCPPMQFY